METVYDDVLTEGLDATDDAMYEVSQAVSTLAKYAHVVKVAMEDMNVYFDGRDPLESKFEQALRAMWELVDAVSSVDGATADLEDALYVFGKWVAAGGTRNPLEDAA